MNANEIVKVLRCFSNCDNTRCHDCGVYEKYCEDHAWKDDYYEIAADCIESLQAEIDGMRSNWYKCADNYQQKCRDIAELESKLAKQNTAIRAEDERYKNALKEIIKLACESVEREKTLARLEAEVMARLEERHEND